MPPEPELLLDEQEDYASSEDSDFAPHGAEAGDDDDAVASNSDSGSESQVVPQKRKLHQSSTSPDDAADLDNSGDEAIITKGRKKKRKRGKEKIADQGGSGGADVAEDERPLIKTRSMKAVEKAERKAKVATGPVTVDVNALWASMTSAPIIPSSSAPEPHPYGGDGTVLGGDADEKPQVSKADGEEADTITIRRTYNFAGRVVTETKTVSRDSAEARLYLASQPDGQSPSSSENSKEPRKIRRAFRSAFEPLSLNPSSPRSDLDLGTASLLRTREEAAANNAKKLNTVQKSKLDWAAHVDEEGMREELELAGRKRGNFGDTQDFLARVEDRKEEEARRVRLAGKA